MAIATPCLEQTGSEAGDRTGSEFWERWWRRTPLPAPMDPLRPGLKNYPYRSFHRFFERTFRGRETRAERLIEIGCAQSVFLPYFARYFGFQVTGLDRSPLGCERARLLLELEGVQAEVVRADFFGPRASMQGAFDVVVSFGLIEHFDNTGLALRATAQFLKPGGIEVSLIPNFAGAMGWYQRLLDGGIYNAHVVVDKQGLADAHRDAGLEVIAACYLLPLSLEVINVGRWPNRRAARLVDRAHTAVSRLVWFTDERVCRLAPNRRTSPYIACVARKPG